MQRFDVLRDGPWRYIHSTETGALLITLVEERRESSQRCTGKFIDEQELASPGRTLREWKAILARRYPNITAAQ